MHADQFAYSPGSGGAGIGRGLDGGDVATNDRGDITGTDLFPADED